MHDRKVSIADRLTLLMEVHGESYRAAAERCGLDHSTLIRIRQGDTGNPATLERIAEGYGVPLRWLKGDPDLNTDFTMAVLGRPLQERIELLWDNERRVGYALAFLAGYQPGSYTAAELAKLLSVSISEVEGTLQHRRGRFDSAKLESLCDATGLPRHWLHTGLIGREDEEKFLTGLAEWAVNSLFQRIGVHADKDTVRRAVKAMV